METIKNFITKQYKTIITVLIVLFISYWVIFILTPRNTMISENKEKIDLLNDVIKNIRKEQNTLEDRITDVNKDIVLIENNITKIKKNKTNVGEIYHEKIVRIDDYTEPELDSFFSNRYK